MTWGKEQAHPKNNTPFLGVFRHDLTSCVTSQVIKSDCSVYVHICRARAFDDGLKHILRYEIWKAEIVPVSWICNSKNLKRQACFAHRMTVSWLNVPFNTFKTAKT